MGVEELCGVSFSRTTISNLTKELDGLIGRWRHRRLEKSYPYLVIDARYEYIRKRDTGVMQQAVFIIVGVDETGHREILAVEVGNSESEDSWREIFRSLKSRGLRGVRYVVSDDHQGLVNGLGREFQGVVWHPLSGSLYPQFCEESKQEG